MRTCIHKLAAANAGTAGAAAAGQRPGDISLTRTCPMHYAQAVVSILLRRGLAGG